MLVKLLSEGVSDYREEEAKEGRSLEGGKGTKGQVGSARKAGEEVGEV